MHRQRKYDQVFRRMATRQHLSEKDIPLTENELINEGLLKHRNYLFLGCYSPTVIDNMLKDYRVKQYLEQKGIPNVSWYINIDDPYLHRFMMFSEKNGVRQKLIELVMQRKNLRLPLEKDHYINLEFLHIEWLMMQNPYLPFREDKPPLPGQKAPGLGVGPHILKLLLSFAKYSNTHGIINSPNYLHTAIFFSRAFHFMDPKVEAFMLNVKRNLLPHYSYHTLSWADEFGALQHSRNYRSIVWRPAIMIAPTSPQARSYFNTRYYRKAVHKYRKKLQITVNMRKYKRKLKEYGKA